MRYLSASIIFPISSPPINNGIIVVDDNGTILDVLDSRNSIEDKIEEFDGILCPGFVNTHCHLELSHMKGRINTHSGLTGFISEIISKRNESPDIIFKKAKDADDEMYANGIVAVGDISNSDVTIEIKKNSKIQYHTFIELFDLLPERAQTVFDDGLLLLNKFTAAGLSSSLSPHAPYTVSGKLMRLIADYSIEHGGLLTIHNQETESENEMFEKSTGALFENLKRMLPAFAGWNSTHKSSLEFILELLPKGLPLQLVHNIFTRKSDLPESTRNLFFCLCVRANEFIENSIPDIDMLLKSNFKITIGTDSYASNYSLSILEELKIIKQKFSISNDELLKCATLNGAEFLGITDMFGSFEKGKIPGVVLIDHEMKNAKRII